MSRSVNIFWTSQIKSGTFLWLIVYLHQKMSTPKREIRFLECYQKCHQLVLFLCSCFDHARRVAFAQVLATITSNNREVCEKVAETGLLGDMLRALKAVSVDKLYVAQTSETDKSLLLRHICITLQNVATASKGETARGVFRENKGEDTLQKIHERFAKVG